MKSPEEHLKRWLHPVVFAIWTGFIVYLLASQRYVAFLRPEFGLLLAVAHFVAMGFMLVAMVRPNTMPMDVSAVLRVLVLLVPVLYFVAMPDTMLGNQAFKKRFLGPNNGAIGRQAPSGELDNARQEGPLALTILEILLRPKFYAGQRVLLTGMILRDEGLKPHFGGRDTAVYRFLINCCAADALPLAIALDSDQAHAFANDQWVQVEGVFDLQQINGKSVPMISQARITRVEAPAVPYLF